MTYSETANITPQKYHNDVSYSFMDQVEFSNQLSNKNFDDLCDPETPNKRTSSFLGLVKTSLNKREDKF